MSVQPRMSMSRVKRDKIKHDEHLKKRFKMRNDLPVLTKEEVRRYRLPLHRALFCELEEQNLPSSAAFLNQLIDYQKWLRKSHGPDSRIWARPRLINSPDILNQLVDGFKAAERAHYVKDIATECDNFLRLGVKFSFGTSDWWWLGQQLLSQAVHICSKYHGDGQRRFATSKYIYGKFLFESEEDREQAIPTLKEARVLANGHSWTAAKYLHYPQKTVFVECCIVLYKALLAEAKSIMVYEPEDAIALCAKARRRAYDACDHEGEAKSLMLQGNCEVIAGKVNDAAESFYKVLLMHIKAKRVEETCEARICLIQAYLKLGNWQESYAHLQQLLQFAESHNMPYYIGQSYRYMGEYYLNHGNPDLATPLLIKALNAFHEIGDINNREQTKNFAAVSAGQELMPKYINFILKCGQGGTVGWNYLQKLVRWKDARDIAWSESSCVLKSGMSFENALIETGKSGGNLNSVLTASELVMNNEENQTNADTAEVQETSSQERRSSVLKKAACDMRNSEAGENEEDKGLAVPEAAETQSEAPKETDALETEKIEGKHSETIETRKSITKGENDSKTKRKSKVEIVDHKADSMDTN